MMMTAADIHRWLTAFPYPGATDLHLDELGCGFTVGGAVLRYDFDGWIVNGMDFDHKFPPPDEVSAEKVHAEIARVLALPADPPKPVRLARMEPGHLYGVLLADPFPGAVDLRLDKTGLHFTVGGVAVRFDGAAFWAPRHHVRSTLPHPSATNAQGVHAEIHRVLAVVMGAGEPDAPQDRLTDEIDALAAVLTWEGAEAIYPADLVERARRMAGDAAQYLLDREFVAAARDARARLAAYLGMDGAGFAQIVEAIERGRSADDVVSLKLDLGEARTRIADLESELAGVRQAVKEIRTERDRQAIAVTQERAQVQRVKAERDATIDELRTALEAIAAHVGLVESDRWAVGQIVVKVGEVVAKVKRLLRQRRAAHAVLDEAGIGLESAGSPRWTLARRCRAAVEPVWGYLDALQAFDEVGAIVGVKGKTGERGFIDAVIARVKALHQGHAAIAALLHADAADSGAVAKAIHALKSRLKVLEVTAEQWEADNATVEDCDRLVARHGAPVKIGDRTLSPAERAAFVIRRLTRAAQNARAEAAALRAEQEEIAEALGNAPAYAEHADGSLVGLNLVERIRTRLT